MARTSKISKTTPTRVMVYLLLIVIVFLIINIARAVTPNPGHPWTEVGDGTFQVTGPTALRTYTFPDANSVVLTDNADVTVAQGGTGLSSAAQGDIFYASAANTLSALAKNTTATRYLSNTGSSNNPAWAQVDLTNGVTGILTSVNGGTGNGFTKFTGPASSEKTFTLPNASAVVLTDNADVTVAQGGTGLSTLTANNLIVGAGASNVTFIAPGTSGNRLASNGTTWASVSLDPKYMFPQGYSTTAAAVTATVSNTSYFLYLGKIPAAVTTCNISNRVTTLAATITWAEVGIFKGTVPAWGGTASLTRLGFTNVASTFNSTGAKTTAVTVSGSTAGDDLWVAYGSQATTPFQIAGATGDNSQSGVFQSAAATRISTASPITTALPAAALVAGWLGVACS